MRIVRFLLLPVIVLCCLSVSFTATAQMRTFADTGSKKPVSDTVRRVAAAPVVNKDSLAFAVRPHPFQPNPKKAGLYAAILPGLGQVYNRQYWKIPIVYAGMGAAGYFVSQNLTNYRSYRKSYVSLLANPNYMDDNVKKYHDVSTLKQLQSDYEKNLNVGGLLTTVAYFLQVLDAITSAHLKNFDMSRDISLHMQPVAMPANGFGLALVMDFR